MERFKRIPESEDVSPLIWGRYYLFTPGIPHGFVEMWQRAEEVYVPQHILEELSAEEEAKVDYYTNHRSSAKTTLAPVITAASAYWSATKQLFAALEQVGPWPEKKKFYDYDTADGILRDMEAARLSQRPQPSDPSAEALARVRDAWLDVIYAGAALTQAEKKLFQE